MTTTTTLDAIIDANQRPTTRAPRAVMLRPFTPADWAGYAGCESSEPEIADHSWGDVILDGRFVGAVIIDDEFADDATNWNTEFPTEAAARLVALSIRTPHDVEQLLGEAVN